MDRHYRHHFNPNGYNENLLSPFGNKVLTNLKKQWGKVHMDSNNSDQHPQPFPTRQNKVLSFNDDSVNFPNTQAGLTVAASCDHLLDINLEYEAALSENIVSHNDSRHPIISNNENLLCSIPDNDSSETAFIERKINKVANINWDDMLDAEIFVKMDGDGKTDGKDIQENHNIKHSTISEAKANISHMVAVGGVGKKYKKKSKNLKNKVSDIHAKVPKFDKNTEGSNINKPILMVEMKQTNKNNLRKQKYTKAVKNWLDNVETPHVVSENVENKGKDAMMINVESNAHLNKMCRTPGKQIDSDKTLTTAKKIVQAQLTNKDGIMKFGKPKVTEVAVRREPVTLQSTTKDSGNKKCNKFITPIKSQTIEDVKFQVHSVDEENIVSHHDNLLQLKDKEIIAVLIYSNGFCQLNSHYTDDTCSPSGIIICYNDMFYCFKTPGPHLKEALSNLLNNNITVCYDGRSVLLYLGSHLELDIGTADMRDIKIGATLLDPDNPPEDFSGVQRLMALSSSVTSTECALQKSSWYVSQLKECWLKLLAMLKEHSLWDVFIDIEMKVLPIITDMELRGICVDMDTLHSMEQAVVARLKSVEEQCYKAAGKVFQINSPAQVRALLYDDLQLDNKCNLDIRGTIAKGAKSTCESTLRRLAAASQHRLPRLILEYRHLHKAHTTFLAGIAQHVHHGVVRPTWVQMASATGRIASSNPNLQAIPKAPFSLVLFPGPDDEGVGAGAGVRALALRACYVARAGRRLVAADFRHVECRVVAQLAADRALLRALREPRDLFTVLAADWLKKPESEIVAEERERTKRLVYASLYGAGPRKLMEILGASYPRALHVAASFHDTFPSLKTFGGAVWRRCVAARGRVRSVRGRVRCLPVPTAAPASQLAHAQRQALNFVVQGSAADVCKTAMVRTTHALRALPGAARLLLQLHDELLWEVDAPHVRAAAAAIQREMEQCGRACGMSLALPVSLRVGADWAHMAPYSP